jgi:hypothetical protein
MEDKTIQYHRLEQTEIQDALVELGFKLSDRGAYWQTSAIWRNGDNQTAIQIYKDSGVWRDFVEDIGHQPFTRLVGKVLGTSDKKRIQKYVRTDKLELNFLEERDNRVKIKMDQVYAKEDLKKLLPHHKFYLDKKISLETLKMYYGGYATAGKMNGRYTFPIFQDKVPQNIIGFTGRSLRYASDSTFPKWKHLGQRRNWLYPLYLPTQEGYAFRRSIEKKEEVIIVESVGDSLALTENKIYNHLVTFGLGISSKQICELVALNPSQIIIAYNNDNHKSVNAGLESAIKDFIKLMDFFDLSKICIKLPIENDFSDMHVKNVFNSWVDKQVNAETQLKFLLKKLESSRGFSIISNRKKLKSKIEFLKEHLDC